MKRSLDQSLIDLRRRVASWSRPGTRPGVFIFVYPPEWEARMLARFPRFAEECTASGWPVELVDLGQGFCRELDRSPGLVDALTALEREGPRHLLHDLSILAETYLTSLLTTPADPTIVARLLVNTGALAAFTSYSAIGNALHCEGTDTGLAVPSVLAFPGESDERSLNLLGLRVDTNYRIPRI